MAPAITLTSYVVAGESQNKLPTRRLSSMRTNGWPARQVVSPFCAGSARQRFERHSEPSVHAEPSANAGPGVVQLAANRDGYVTNRMPFAVDTLPEAFEKEPNNDLKHAQNITLPMMINGRIDRPGDWGVLYNRVLDEVEVATPSDFRRHSSLGPLAAVCALLLLVVATGCSKSEPPRVPVQPVTGQVTFDGRPAKGAWVVLHPTNTGESFPSPNGYADAQGNGILAETPSAPNLYDFASAEWLIYVEHQYLSARPVVDALVQALARHPGLEVVVITAYATFDTAVEAVKRGAADYLPKPFTPAQIRHVVDRAVERRALAVRLFDLEERLGEAAPEASLETASSRMRAALDVLEKVAGHDVSVLLRGESGTGKGVLARVLHARSPRRERPFVVVNCPTLSEELLASELFGHVRGAFTGAVRDQQGRPLSIPDGALRGAHRPIIIAPTPECGRQILFHVQRQADAQHGERDKRQPHRGRRVVRVGGLSANASR